MAQDSEMAGAEVETGAATIEEDDDAGSEDLEAESSGSEEEEIEEEEGDGDADEAMEVDGVEKANGTNGTAHQHVDEVMAH